MAGPSLRVERPVGRRAGRSTPSFSSTAKPRGEAPAPAEVVDRLREGLSRIEKERRGIERGILELLDPGSRPDPPNVKSAGEERYRRLLAAELQNANVGLEELVLNLRTVLGKGFRSRVAERSATARQKEPTGDGRAAAK